jgi:hypothetical protein
MTKVRAISVGGSPARSVINRVASVIEQKQGGLIFYGEDNLLPLKIQQGIASSGTATNCVEKIKTFTQANGFEDKIFASSMANPEQTFDDWLEDACHSIAPNKGFYLNVQVDLTGKPAHFYIVDFDSVRRDSNGSFWVKKDWDKSTKGAKNYPRWQQSYFNNPEEARAVMVSQLADEKNGGKQLGFIHFAYHKSFYLKHYPLGGFYSGFEDVESDAGLQKLENSNILAGFKTDVIISMVGELSTDVADDEEMSDYDMLQKRIKDFRNPETRKALLLNAESEEGLPKVTIFPLNQLLDGVDKSRDRVPRFVCRHFGVPPALIGLSDPEGWGNAQAFKNKLKLFALMTISHQNLIIRTLKKFMPDKEIFIGTLNIVDYIDPALVDKLTADEQRNLAGYEALPKTDTGTGPSLAETLGTGTTTSLKDVVADPTMPAAVKVQFLIIVFNLTVDKANLLVYGNTTGPAPKQEGEEDAN